MTNTNEKQIEIEVLVIEDKYTESAKKAFEEAKNKNSDKLIAEYNNDTEKQEDKVHPGYVQLAGSTHYETNVVKTAFNQIKNTNFTYAIDYEDAISKLDNNKYNGVITDIFFPQKTGTNKKEKGYDALYEIVEMLYLDKKSYGISDTKMKDIRDARKKAVGHPYLKSLFCPFLDNLTTKVQSERINPALCGLIDNLRVGNEDQQALGILLVKKLREEGRNFVVATGHHHDSVHEATSHGLETYFGKTKREDGLMIPNYGKMVVEPQNFKKDSRQLWIEAYIQLNLKETKGQIKKSIQKDFLIK